MTWKHAHELRRWAVGLVLGVWVILLAFAAARAVATGPSWGMRLAHGPEGSVIAADIAIGSLSDSTRIRVGTEIVQVGDAPAAEFVDR
jgi:hypothetical protein